MSLSSDDDFAAAEFALGTLDTGERAAIAARRQREPELDAAILDWEARLAPLAESAPPVETPRDYFTSIEARIAAPKAAAAPPLASTGPADEMGAMLRTRLARWRAVAIGASSLAALLMVGLVFRETTREAGPHEFVAVLQKSADSPAFTVSINLDTREVTVRPVAAAAPAGKAYELWIIADKLGAPRSLGVIDATEITKPNKLAGIDPATVESATYAVTVEPPGGSPDGKPSGAPVFVGKLIPVGP